MAVGSVPLFLADATLPDGTAANLSARATPIQGTQVGARWAGDALDFDGAGDLTIAWWTLRLPSNFVSTPVLKVQWCINAIANAVQWQARVAAITPADPDTPFERALAAANVVTTNVNTLEANRLIETSVPLTNADAMAAGDLVELEVLRDSSLDSCCANARLLTIALDYA